LWVAPEKSEGYTELGGVAENMRYVVKWYVYPEELEKIAEMLKETPVVSLEVESDTELIIIYSRSERPYITDEYHGKILRRSTDYE
jgi:hypothetical protein